jgi:lipopolysaccharide export system ATP-binding protein
VGSVLEIDSVLKSFGTRQVLTDIYIKLQTGDILGIFGKNGTGKSTLLKIIFGTLRAESQFIRLDGQVLDSLNKRKNNICFLPQDDFVPKQLKLHQAVKLFIPNIQHHTFFDDPLLNGYQNSKVSGLSAGELRYFEIKLILNSPSKFILLDEPFTGISPILVEKLSDLIKISAKEKGIILTDHEYKSVLDTANRYGILVDGEIKYFENKTDLIKWGYINESKFNLTVPRNT